MGDHPCAHDRLTESPNATYSYDAEGNLEAKTDTTTDHVTTYAYDYRNRLIGVTERDDTDAVVMQATYTYDALDRRIATEVDDDGAGPDDPVTRWTVYDGQNPYADVDGAGDLDTRYLYGLAIDELLARTDDGGDTDWYLPDRLGSIRDVVDTAGTVTYHAAYGAFGGVVSETGTGGDRFKFTGREYDAETGTYYYRARYYDPATGRFINQDPIKFAAGDANLYRYVGNNPTGFTDPTGLYSTWWEDYQYYVNPFNNYETHDWIDSGLKWGRWFGWGTAVIAGTAAAGLGIASAAFGMSEFAVGVGYNLPGIPGWHFFWGAGRAGHIITSQALGRFGAMPRIAGPTSGWILRGIPGGPNPQLAVQSTTTLFRNCIHGVWRAYLCTWDKVPPPPVP